MPRISITITPLQKNGLDLLRLRDGKSAGHVIRGLMDDRDIGRPIWHRDLARLRSAASRKAALARGRGRR